MKIEDVMSKDCDWIAPEATLTEAAKIMKDRDIGFLPVGENDRLIGTITDRDIVVNAVAKGEDINSQTVKDNMTPELLYCFNDQNIDDICTNMSDIKVRRLPVVNRDKRLVGIVSLGDLAQKDSNESGQTLKSITACDNSVSKAA